MNELLVTALSGLLTLIGVCVTAWASAKKTRDRVRNNGKTWESTVDDNVWEPGTPGTEALWKEESKE